MRKTKLGPTGPLGEFLAVSFRPVKVRDAMGRSKPYRLRVPAAARQGSVNTIISAVTPWPPRVLDPPGK
jgi:hypothetical protein